MTFRVGQTHRERIIRGKDNWWFVGPGGIAKLSEHHLDTDGSLTPRASDFLRDKGLFETTLPSSYSLTVLTSTDCNLGCGYCFQNLAQDPTGGNRPPRITHSRLKSETITTILEFARRQMAAVRLEKLRILLFGGEPLLNPRGCVELLARAADYGLIEASMISNATLFTPRTAVQLADLGLRSVQVTFDGDAPDHDRIRVRRSGGGTFDAIIANIVAVSAVTPIRWNLRVNVSHHNHAGVDRLIDRLADRLDPSRCSMSIAWVGDVGIGYANELEQGAGLADQTFRWRRRAMDAGFRVGRPRALSPCLTCSWNDGLYGAVVNADGVLSSCWDTAGRSEWSVGTADTGYLPAADTEGRWVSCEDRRQNEDDEGVASVTDLADARFLDHLAATGRL